MEEIMKMFNDQPTVSRRRFVSSSLVSAALLVVACRAPATVSQTSPTGASTSSALAATVLTPTAANVDPEDATPAETEGPYFKPNSPERTSLVGAGVVGTKLALTGQVVSQHGQPIAKALLDFWQADGQGNYDNAAYTLRGHQFTDAEGRYQLATVVPGLYPGRTRHIHVKVQAPNQAILTTQLYFPNEPRNTSDSLFNAKLLMTLQDAADGSKLGQFKFVLNVG